MYRRTYELKDGWMIAKDENDCGMRSGWENAIPTDASSAFVPSIIQQFLPEYHGLAYYWCRFTPALDTFDGGQILLTLGGVDYKADVWLNGIYLGSEEGSEAPARFDVTDSLYTDKENLLAVRLLNPCEKTVDGLNLMNTPHRNKVIKKQAGNCLNSGGMMGRVTLEALPSAYVDDAFAIADYQTGSVTLRTALQSAKEQKATVSVKIFEKSLSSPLIVQTEEAVSLSPGIARTELSLTVKDFKPWHIDSPNLYLAFITLYTEGGEHTYTVRFGFREFCVKDGFFYLNGKRIFLKSAHSGNAFPIGQALPVDPDQMRRDFIYAKSCGFNMLRAIAGVFLPEQLELADEIGLLIYEECSASWCLGYSMWQSWTNDEEFARLAELYPDMPLGDESAMLARWVNSTEKMILRDRNHPSIVTWGLLNETKDSGVYRTARDFLPRLRELDPTRLVILSSGRWDLRFEVGSAANPYAAVWQRTWGIDGHPEVLETFLQTDNRWEKITPDNHYYAAFPFGEADKALYRSMGREHLPVFLSEMGHGPVFNVIDEVRHFKQFGAREDLEDYTWLNSQAEAFRQDFKRLGMSRTFAFPEQVFRESQKNAAMARREIFDAVRSNPRIAGYSLTGLLDHGWCGEGLWSYWREWKPETFDVVSEGWARLRFCLFASHNVYDDEPITVEAVLANDGVLHSGTYTAHLAITEKGRPIYTFDQPFTVKEGEFASPIVKLTLPSPLPEGEYELCAEMDEAAPRANKLPFSVKAREKNRATGCCVSCLGASDAVKRLLASAGASVSDFAAQEAPRVLLVGAGDTSAVKQAIDAAERGTRVLFLEPAALAEEVGLAELRRVIPDASFFPSFDWLYHKEMVLNERSVFEGLGQGLAQGRDFVKEWPKTCLKTALTPDYPICPAFETGSYRADGSYYLVHALSGYRFGKGAVYCSTFLLTDNVGSPVADRLLLNLVKYLHTEQE